MTSSVSQTKENDKLTINNVDLAFRRFWDEAPRKDGKKPAQTAFKRAVRDTSEDVIIDGMKAYAAMVKAKGTEKQYILMPATWLNQARWEDDMTVTGSPPSDNFGVAQKWMPASEEQWQEKVRGGMLDWYKQHRPDVIDFAKSKGWL